MATVQLRDVTKTYPTGVTAVDSINLTVDDGEVMALLGPSGCGKSSVLRLIAGLEPADAGEIRFGANRIDVLPSHERGVAMVFQDYALYPHLTVQENISFPLLTTEPDEAARLARVRDVAKLLGLEELLGRRPARLSGGQRQRVAIARAIARQPEAFLLDEPLSNIDAHLRDDLRADLTKIIRRTGVATVYVTHDQSEALLIADRIAVMRRGRIEQVGTPEEIYNDPRRLFVAAFIGSPRMNLLQAAIQAVPGERTVVDLGSQVLELPWSDERAVALADHHSERITVGVRPDALTLLAADAPAAISLDGTVRAVELRGHDVLAHLRTGCSPTPNLISQLDLPDAPGELAQALGTAQPRPAPPPRTPLRDRLDRLARLVAPHRRDSDEPERYAIWPSYDPARDTVRQGLGDLLVRVPVADAPRSGDTVRIAVDVDRLLFFDRAGDRIMLPSAGTDPVADPDDRQTIASAPRRRQVR